MDFKNWISLYENATISDVMRNADREVVQQYKQPIQEFLKGYISPKFLPTAVNFFAYLYISEQLPADVDQIYGALDRDWNTYGAYVTDRISKQKQNFVKVFTRQDLNQANAAYHRDLIISGRNYRKGPDGLSVVDVADFLTQKAKLVGKLGNNYLPGLWRGWKWASLGCGSSKLEGAAGSHCGNAGARKGQNILSLRDTGNRVHLSFILDTYTGMIGEAKATGNQKPVDHYHPAILALIFSGYIKGFTPHKNGDYLPEKDFRPKDLSKRAKQLADGALSKQNNHKVPSNYHSLNWAEQWTQDQVDGMPLQQKVNLLDDVLKIHSNHQPFEVRYYDNEKQDYVDVDAQIIHLGFNLEKLALDAVDGFKNIKQIIEILSRLTVLFHANKIFHAEVLKKYRPDLPEDATSEDPVPFSDSWVITNDSLEAYAKRALTVVENSNSRDKLALADQLDDVGYRSEDNPEGKTYEEKYKEWNIFEKEINSLRKEALEHYAEHGIPSSLQYEAAEAIGHVTKKYPSACWFTVTDGGQMTEHHFDIQMGHTSTVKYHAVLTKHDVRNKQIEKPKGENQKALAETGKRLKKEINEVVPRIKHLLVKKGYSEFLGRRKFLTFASQAFINEAHKSLARMLRYEYQGQVAIKIDNNDSSELSMYYYQDARKHIRAILDHGVDSALYEVEDKIRELFIKAFDRLLKKLPNIILANADSIIAKVNNETEYDKKKRKSVLIPRDVRRRHAAV